MPYFLNKEALNWGAKTGYFWGGLCALCAIWCVRRPARWNHAARINLRLAHSLRTYFRCPEPRNRTYGTLTSISFFAECGADFFFLRAGELDVLFANRISARKFAQTDADQFAGHGGAVSGKAGEIVVEEE